MNVEFYFDPACPFCWITSRWLLVVSGERDINIEWKPFSLAIKNNELDSGEGKYAEMHRASHRALRMMMAAHSGHNTPLIDLYTSFGIKHHVAGFEIDNDLLTEILTEKGLPVELLNEADNTKYDQLLEGYIKDATDTAGQDIGVPTIVFTNKDGKKQGFFGPVLQELPDNKECLELWDGLSKLATNSSFYELKRSRPGGTPDIGSTARC